MEQLSLDLFPKKEPCSEPCMWLDRLEDGTPFCYLWWTIDREKSLDPKCLSHFKGEFL